MRADRVPISLADGRKALTQAIRRGSTRLQRVHVLAQRRTLLVERARRRALVVDRALLKAHAAAARRGSPPSPGGRRACRTTPRGPCGARALAHRSCGAPRAAWRAPARAAAAPNAEAQRQVEAERLAVGCFPRGSPEELCRSLIGGARKERARVEETAGHLTVLANLLQYVPLR
ncbi:hypothetical protein T492DRAFT_1005060 [Pavlovales sp. CCMP2436]|nr:hypothetical protein T492DRAFT_1005060 [Pavlovales sp. CCMP2436]